MFNQGPLASIIVLAALFALYIWSGRVAGRLGPSGARAVGLGALALAGGSLAAWLILRDARFMPLAVAGIAVYISVRKSLPRSGQEGRLQDPSPRP